MPLLRFTLSEDGVGALRDALACLSKFSEEVSLEATKDKLDLTAMNSSKSAYAKVSFASNRFFSMYHFEGAAQSRNKFFCMSSKYRLPFEVTPPVHAIFNMEEASNHWSMSSRTLRQLMDHFGPGIEYLDIHADDDQTVNFTCYTEKVSHGDVGKEVLKKPLHTSIAVERDEFNDFEISEDSVHVVISVKDFRAITQHAAPLNSEITANYSSPSRPMQLGYRGDGIKCEFLLMTVGERGAPGQKGRKGKANAKGPKPPQLEAGANSRATSRAPSAPRVVPEQVRKEKPIPPLRPSASRLSQRPPPPAFDDDDSLFVAQDNDTQWEPVNLNDDEEEDDNARLEWDASAQPTPTRRGGPSTAQGASGGNASASRQPGGTPAPSEFEPTQRLSDVRKYGLFGE
ncbi:hypothetical protein LQW54_007346 [Pestalotiopsis sp. IQ-011]